MISNESKSVIRRTLQSLEEYNPNYRLTFKNVRFKQGGGGEGQLGHIQYHKIIDSFNSLSFQLPISLMQLT